jgi:YVTN family beta-propeller protein
VGLIDISSPDPKQWHHKEVFIVDHQLDLHYSLTSPVDRDNGSGYALRGTVFTPDGRYLFVGCMGGGGGIAVIDLQRSEYMGRLLGMMGNVRHLVIKNGYLYLSINGGGYVQRIELDKFVEAARQMKNKKGEINGWTNCKVGTGARTIELSPSGKYIFAACNNASSLYVVDAKAMKVIAHISVDSYPVGLDISKDGRYIFTTSQGRSGGGGNAVNIFRVDYQ